MGKPKSTIRYCCEFIVREANPYQLTDHFTKQRLRPGEFDMLVEQGNGNTYGRLWFCEHKLTQKQAQALAERVLHPHEVLMLGVHSDR